LAEINPRWEWRSFGRHFGEAEARLARTVQFVQLGAGARFDDDGRPVRLAC